MNSAYEHQWLNDPELVATPRVPEVRKLSQGQKCYLPIPAHISSPPALNVMLQRRSQRTFGSIERQQLSALLWHSLKIFETRIRDDGSLWQHRPIPSAGGCHPIDILLLSPMDQAPPIFSIYDPVAHALVEFGDAREEEIAGFRTMVDQVLPAQQGTIIVFAAQFSRTLFRYRNGESLVWRDAGALLMGLSVAAEALELNLCALGMTADNFVRKLYADDDYGGVGACIVGAR